MNSSSAARPWPMMRGRMAQAPMSQPARPTRVNRKAVLLRGVPRRMSDGHRQDRAGAGADAVDRRDDRLRAGAHRLDEIAGHARESEQLGHRHFGQRAR